MSLRLSASLSVALSLEVRCLASRFSYRGISLTCSSGSSPPFCCFAVSTSRKASSVFSNSFCVLFSLTVLFDLPLPYMLLSASAALTLSLTMESAVTSRSFLLKISALDIAFYLLIFLYIQYDKYGMKKKKQAFACLTVYIRNASINSNPAVYAKIYTAEVSQSPFFFTSDLHSGVVSIAGMESTRKTKVLYVHSSSSPCIG